MPLIAFLQNKLQRRSKILNKCVKKMKKNRRKLSQLKEPTIEGLLLSELHGILTFIQLYGS